MLDQFGSNLNSLEYALTGQNEQEFMDNLEMDVPKMDYSTAQTETGTQSSNVSPTVSPRSDNSYKQMPIPSQQNILVSFGSLPVNFWSTSGPLSHRTVRNFVVVLRKFLFLSWTRLVHWIKRSMQPISFRNSTSKDFKLFNSPTDDLSLSGTRIWNDNSHIINLSIPGKFNFGPILSDSRISVHDRFKNSWWIWFLGRRRMLCIMFTVEIKEPFPTFQFLMRNFEQWLWWNSIGQSRRPIMTEQRPWQ